MSTFWKQALEAAGWTFAQVFVVTFAAAWAGLAEYDWRGVGAAAASAALAAVGAALSLIKSMVVRKMGVEDTTLISGGDA
jgi:hypothetical protein